MQSELADVMRDQDQLKAALSSQPQLETMRAQLSAMQRDLHDANGEITRLRKQCDSLQAAEPSWTLVPEHARRQSAMRDGEDLHGANRSLRQCRKQSLTRMSQTAG